MKWREEAVDAATKKAAARLAGEEDIAAMKLGAVIGRGAGNSRSTPISRSRPSRPWFISRTRRKSLCRGF